MSQAVPGIMVILDGLGDRPLACLAGKTPLEAAETPHFDRLAKAGMAGLMDPLFPGVPVATDTGIGMLMGIPSPRDLLPRGPIEAAGLGLAMEPDDVALRCNFATVEKHESGLRILDRRAGRIGPPETTELASYLSEKLTEVAGIRGLVRAATGHRAVLLLRGGALSARISDMDPGAGWEGRGVLPARPINAEDATARRTAEALNELILRSHDLLRNHPLNKARKARGEPAANLLLPRKAGQWHPVRGLVSALGLKAAVIAGENTVVGLGRMLGFSCIQKPTFTGAPGTNLDEKVKTALEASERFDLVFLHIKGADNFAHDGNGEGKRQFIEQVDRALAPLLDCERRAIAICADHSTPSSTGRHSGDPVPVLLAGPGGRRDGVREYGEVACMGGGLGRLSANAFLWSLLDLMGVTQNFRPADLPFMGLSWT